MAEEKIDSKKVEDKEIKEAAPKSKIGLLVAVVLVAAVLVSALGGLAFAHFAKNRLLGVSGRNIRFERELRGGRMDGRGFNGGMMGYGKLDDRTSGKVTAVNDKKFTIDASGTNVDIQITDTTRFPINSASSVKVGDTVVVTGEKDSNGVVQAVRIVVNP